MQVCMKFCPMSPKLHATKLPPHPNTTSQSCQAMVISTPPTSPLSQFPDSFCRYPADLWCSVRFLGCCLRATLLWWVGSILWASQQTGCMYLLIRRESTQCGLFSMFLLKHWEALSSTYLFYQKMQKYEILDIFLLLQTFLHSVHCFKLRGLRDDVQVENKRL